MLTHFLKNCFRHLVEGIVIWIALESTIVWAADARVQQAIGRGVGYLLQTQSSAGTWDTWGSHTIGETALAGMALVAGGHPVDSKEVRAAAQAVRVGIETDSATYDTSLAIMFLDRLGLSGDEGLLNRLGSRLSVGQCRGGAWSYSLQGGGCLGGDNSNTQFAALAAWISRRHGIANEQSLRQLDQYFRGSFDTSRGGWGYSHGAGATPTMTCAGLVGIATLRGAEQQRITEQSGVSASSGGQSEGGRPRPAAAMAANDPLAKRALSALGNELALANRDQSAPINSDLYFFWSLERVGVIYDVKDIGGVDWYQWGSSRLLRGQLPSGEWRGVSSKGWSLDESVGTSFGILFLSRANVAADLSAAVGSGGGVGEPPPGLGGGSEMIRRSAPNEAPPAFRANPVQPEPKAKNSSPKKPEPKVGPPVLDPF